MNLHTLLSQRQRDRRPVRVGVIGCGKFASMFLAQAVRTPGLHVAAICDLDPARARRSLQAIAWPAERYGADTLDAALASGATHVSDDALAMIAAPPIEVVVDATGDPAAGIGHALACAEHGKHVVMVNVEADVLAGPYLAAKVRAAGAVYSLAYGDQPALIAEQVDWARSVGFDVVCAGKGTKYLPQFHASTPDTVWGYYGLSPERAREGGMNPKMFNSFLDGTKSGIEMAAVANATGLAAPTDGLGFPPCAAQRLAQVLKPKDAGGVLDRAGMVEVVSSVARDGSEVADNLRWGVYVTFEAPSDYVARCFKEYGLDTDDSGRYCALYRRHHLIGLELGVSVASAALRGEPTGAPQAFNADVVATAKRALKAGEMLDGEGGYTVWGRLMPARDSLAMGGLPIGLATAVRLKRDVAEGTCLRWDDVDIAMSEPAVKVRKEMEVGAAPGRAA